MSESPPPYYPEDVLKAEKAAFEALLTDEVQNALQIDVGMSHMFSLNPRCRNCLVDELLSKTSALNYDFLQVSILLQSVDTQNIGDPLAPTWAGYRTVNSSITCSIYYLMPCNLTEISRACVRLRTRCQHNHSFC